MMFSPQFSHVVLKIGWIADIDLVEQTLVSMICFGNEEANRSQKLFGGISLETV